MLKRKITFFLFFSELHVTYEKGNPSR